MAPPQPALQSIEPHIHVLSETCPVCEQPIPNEKAKEIRERAAALERRATEAANARAAQQIATERARIEADAKAKVEQAERDKAEAVRKTTAEAAVKIEAAKAEGQTLAEASYSVRLEVAEKAKVEAEKAKTDTEAVAVRKIAAAEEAAKAKQEESHRQLEAANNEKTQALAKARQVETERDAVVEARVREVREALEKHEVEALAAFKATKDDETRKLAAELDALRRQVEKQRAAELGEGAHIKLLDALKAEFPEDHIRRIPPGVSGADILHTVMRNGVASGSILYESKNSIAWRDDYVTKLVRDQTAAQADHAVLATLKFPKDTAQIEIRDGIIVVNPARAVAIAQILRKHLLHVHTLRLSKSERAEKMAGLYDFMTSGHYALLMGRLDTESDALLELQEVDKKYHDKHWQKEGLLIRSMQKVKAEIDTAVELIIGSSPGSE
jgi:hypothetical protein